MRNAAAERLVDTAAAVAGLVPAMRDRAAGLDRESAFPAEDIADLQRAGALAVPLPIETPGASVIEQLAKGDTGHDRESLISFDAKRRCRPRPCKAES